MARLSGGDEVEGIDEEFLFHLNRGSELLLRGDADPAKASLERALELRPKDAKVLGLLGQAYYKLARFDDATRVWQRLVDDNPVEAGARVNLGLANLKAKRYLDAAKQLEIAVDLNPDHKKAMGYLGLALLESGNLTRAREWFQKAGSEQMVARCDELIAGRAGPSTSAAAPSAPPASSSVHPDPSTGSGEGRTDSPADAIEVTEVSEDDAAAPEATPAPRAGPALESGRLGPWSAARLVRTGRGETFSVSSGALAVAVSGDVRVRLDGLFATQGKVTIAGEMKRFRGRPTEKTFGEGPTRMHRVSGQGVLLFRGRGRRFTSLELGPDAAYLKEEALFGLEDGIAFENGRVPSSISAELHLVHLRGRGRFLLATAGEPATVDVAPDAPLRVPLAALVGWIGALTPRVCPLVEDGAGPAIVAVELTGDGRVITDPAATAEG